MLNAVKSRSGFFLLLLVVALFLCSGCSKVPKNHWWQVWRTGEKTPTSIYADETTLPPPPEVEAETPRDVTRIPLEGPDQPAPDDLGTPLAPPIREPGETISELQTVFFAFDSATLSDQTKAALDNNYEWLIDHPGIHVLIEGHCDERGTVEYNLNLGQRRADSVREYLNVKGLDAATLHTISYGEERPMVDGHDESAWSQNRRVQFLVY